LTEGAALPATRLAWDLCVAGRFDEAEDMLREVLSRTPDVVAQTLLAKVYLQRGDAGRALQTAGAALASDPTNTDALYTQGRAHRLLGELPAAEACYRRALELAPDHPDVLTSLGVLLRADGRTEEATACYARALEVNPQHAAAAHNLRQARAVRATELRRLADTALAARRPHDALRALAHALNLAPQDAALHLAAGKLHCASGRPQIGLQHVEAAARLAPASVEAHEIARRICTAAGLYERALHYSERLQTLAPSPDLTVACHLLLPSIQESRHAIRETRERYRRGLDAALAADEPLTVPTPIQSDIPFFIASHPSFYLAYHGENNRELHSRLASMYLKRIPGLAMTAAHCRRPGRRPGRLRIGFISRFLRNHSIGRTTRGLIERLSREHFEVHALRIMPSGEDEVTRVIRAAADRTYDLDPDLERAREEIAALELDVLFYQDIGMEQTSYFLAFARLAKVQCVSYGHPDTTGIPNMDYFVSNDLYEPPGAQEHYSEKLVQLHDLPTLAYYYKPAGPARAPARGRWGFNVDQHLYVCPQTLYKLHPDFDPLMSGILTRDPRAVIVLIEGAFAGFGENLRRRFQSSLAAVAERVRFMPALDYPEFLDLLTVADVVLDTVHFNGMNTSLEAFARGTPVVTWPGTMQRGRHTLAMYRKMRINDAIATDADHYVDIAIKIGTDPGYAQALRQRILERNHVLFEDPRVVEEFEHFFADAVAHADHA
jgi:predicted O-linked N-acetylglucosamine transferase (SPINDLY family)